MINFITRQKMARCSQTEVRISAAHNNRENLDYLIFSFSEKACKMMFDDSEYAVIGFDTKDSSRIYFSPENQVNGYKLTIKNGKNGNRRTACFQRIYPENANDWLGDHELKFDKINKLFYVEVGK